MKKSKRKPNIWKYLKKYKLGISLYIFVMLFASACGIFTTIIAANTIELITLAKYKKAITYGFIFLGICTFQQIMWFLSNVIYNTYSNKIMSNLNLDLANQSFKLNSKTYADHSSGTFVLRIVNDPEDLIRKCADIIDVVADLITSLIMLIYIITLNNWIALIFIGILIIGIVVEKQRIKFRRKNKIETKKSLDSVHSLTTEIVRSEKDIKSLGLENRLNEVLDNNYTRYRKARFKTDIVDATFNRSQRIIISTASILALILGITLIDKGLLTLASFMIINSNRDSLNRFIWNIGYISNAFIDIKVCHERMFSLFDEKEFVTEHFGKVDLDRVKGNIEFKNVSYAFKEYDYEATKELVKSKHSNKSKQQSKPKLISKNKVFENLSFKIKPNSTVAFIGKSGSGKSTILNLMSKMYEVDDGEVLIDGVNINKLSKQTLRSNISLVNQFPYIFDMTIKENLLLAKSDASDEEITNAISQASLKEFVDSLPMGIETKVGESGIKLSGGQKQRLAIARALLRKSSIIIFDESTSSLDNFAQEEIKKSIDNLKGKSTIVIVAHRLSTIKNVDKIFFLDNGEIVDSGTFDELFNRNEKFKSMFLAENI